MIHDRVAIGEVKKLTEEDYYVRGCTALLDAVGGAWKADIDRDYEKRGKKNGKKNGRSVK